MRDGAVTVITAGVRSDRVSICAAYGRDLHDALALQDDARRASLSDGVMLDRLHAFAGGGGGPPRPALPDPRARETPMSWTIDRHGRVAVVTMTTNKVNAQNRAFFADLHDAFDRLETDHPDSPVVLTGHDGRFSAGLDLGEHFPLFAGPADGVRDWFAAYRATNMRLFTYPRPTVAAVNGHAFAGGLITSAVCDRRLCVDTGARFALNEVPIGIPMPAVYVRMLTYAWGERTAARASLFGETFDQDQAHVLGMFDELLPADQLLDRAVTVADSIPENTLEHYAFTKRAAQASALRDIADLSDPLDDELPHWFTTDDARHAHKRYWRQLKGVEPAW